MKTIEERAKEYADRHQNAELNYFGLGKVYGYTRIYNAEMAAYERGTKEQKAIDDEEIKKLTSIMEHSASVLGIGTKWFNEDARRAAIAELKREILNYLSD